eukprot:403712-Alexandrium_andersonii.AAC.1
MERMRASQNLPLVAWLPSSMSRTLTHAPPWIVTPSISFCSASGSSDSSRAPSGSIRARATKKTASIEPKTS